MLLLSYDPLEAVRAQRGNPCAALRERTSGAVRPEGELTV